MDWSELSDPLTDQTSKHLVIVGLQRKLQQNDINSRVKRRVIIEKLRNRNGNTSVRAAIVLKAVHTVVDVGPLK